jgi:hypothetical protein
MKGEGKGLSGISFLSLAVAALVAGSISLAQTQTEATEAQNAAEGVPMRWDIAKTTNFAPETFTSGGSASARAISGAQITLTGTGTFLSSGESVQGVAGGGNWTITGLPPALGTPSGTYVVTELVSWQPAPGTLPDGVVDQIGNNADARAGLLVLRVRYSDGTRGVLSLSVSLANGTPAIVLEGITATKDFADFYNAQAPAPGVDGNRAYVHVLSAAATPSCSPNATAVCLGARFKVQVSVAATSAFAIPDTADTGDFWFYSPNNIDVVVKVLDGRAVNNKFWVFVGSLSNIGYTVTVTDTATAAVKTYTNPQGTVASIADTTAF